MYKLAAWEDSPRRAIKGMEWNEDFSSGIGSCTARQKQAWLASQRHPEAEAATVKFYTKFRGRRRDWDGNRY